MTFSAAPFQGTPAPTLANAATAVPAAISSLPVPTSLPEPSALPVPAALPEQEIKRYQEWLAESYRTAISASVRELISEVTAELDEVSTVGLDLTDDFRHTVRGAVRSVAVAIEQDSQTSV